MENNQNDPIQFEGQQNNQQYEAPNNGQNNQQYNQQYGAPNGGQPKQRMVAGLLAIFLGGLGIHHFYLGDNQKGIIYLAVNLGGGMLTCGIASLVIGILSIIDAVKLFNGTTATDFFGNPLV